MGAHRALHDANKVGGKYWRIGNCREISNRKLILGKGKKNYGLKSISAWYEKNASEIRLSGDILLFFERKIYRM